MTETEPQKCQWCMKVITEKESLISIHPKRLQSIFNGESNPHQLDQQNFHLDCSVQLLATMSGNRNGRFDWKVLTEKMIQNW